MLTILKRCAPCLAVALGFICASAFAQEGVTKFKLLLGQTAPLTGPAAELGLETRIGAQLYFEQVNASGGVFGRDIELQTLDDQNDPAKADANIKQLVETDQVLALFGSVGTPSSQAIASAAKRNVPLFATLSGDQGLRTAGGRNIFNLRASTNDEIKKLIETLTTIGQKRFAVFHEESDFGASGLVALEAVLKQKSLKPVGVASVKRDATDAKAAVTALLKAQPDAILLIATYAPAAAFIKEARAAKANAQFYALSAVGGKTLARSLGELAYGVGVSQVVPSPFSPSVAVVREYQTLMKKSGKSDYSFTSLEGYIAAKVLVEALKRASKDITRDKLIDALASMNDYDAGGFRVSFSPANPNNTQAFIDLTLIGRGGVFLK